MPDAPGLIQRVNYIKDFICDPCEAPFIVYVETFLPAFGELVLDWYSFGLDDIIRAYFRPAGLVSRGHKRRLADRKKMRKKNKLVRALDEVIGFEPGEVIGKHLPLHQNMRFRKVGDLQRWLWIIDGIAQRALYYWMVIDLGTEFLYHWSSLLMETEYCQAKARALVHTQDDMQLVSGTPGLYRLFTGETVKERGGAFAGGYEVYLPGPGTVVAGGYLARWGPEYPGVTGKIEMYQDSWETGKKIGESNIKESSDDPNKGLVARCYTKGGFVQPCFRIVGDEGQVYASYLMNYTITAIGSP